MKNILNKHLLNAFYAQFTIIFVTIVSIFSVATLVRLADLTSIAEVGFFDLLTLFILACPQIGFYCLPIAFFAGVAMGLSSLSNDREMTALFAVGVSKKQILKPIIFFASVCSVLLLIVGLWLVPAANVEARNIVEAKKAQISVAVHPGEGAQKFGDWLAFASGEANGELKDVILFNHSSDTKIIFANNGAISTSKDGISLVLENGNAYSFDLNKSQIGRIIFEKMTLTKVPPSGTFEVSDIFNYWLKDEDKRKKDFANTVLGAIFPIISIFLILAIGIFHPRFRKSNSAIYVIISCVAYYLLLLTLSPILLLGGILIIPAIWLGAGYFILKKMSMF